MQSSKLTLVCALAVIPVSLCAKDAQGVICGRLEALIGDLHQRSLFDGAVVVGKNRNVVWEKGFGFANKTKRLEFTPATAADGASLAKTFTAALVLLLHAEGKLNLDRAVQRYLPELPYPEITLRHLLSHTSGLPAYYDYFDEFIPSRQIRTTKTLLGVIAEQKPPLHFPPGTAFEYSSFAYDLAALAAARAAGETYGYLLGTRFFKPLGITSAFLRPARLSDFPGIRTLAYQHLGGDRRLNDVFDFEGFHGGSNIYISAHDLHLWNAAFLIPSVIGEAGRGKALQLARIGDARSGLTLGSWYRSERGDAYWYAGHLQGFHSEVFRDVKSDWSIVYVSNNTLPPWLQPALVRAIRAVVAGNDVRALQAPPTVEIKKAERASLAGIWTFSDQPPLGIQGVSDQMSVRRNGVVYRMFPVSESAFYVPGLHFMIGFARDGKESIERVYVSTNVGEYWGTRRESSH